MFLVRAWELARRVGDWALAAGVCEKLVERAGAELSGKAPRAGIALSMLAAAAAKPTRKQAREAPESAQYQGSVGRLLEPAFTAFQGGFQVSYVAEIMRGRASDAAELERINRREVEAYLAQAASSTGLARQSHLRDAARMARNRGFTDLVRQATAELQAIPVKDLGLKEFTWSVRLPSDRVERFLSGFVASTDWRDGLRFFLKTDCPTGDLAELRQEVRDAAKLTPFLSVTGRTLLSREGLPRIISSEDDDRAAQMQAVHAKSAQSCKAEYWLKDSGGWRTGMAFRPSWISQFCCPAAGRETNRSRLVSPVASATTGQVTTRPACTLSCRRPRRQQEHCLSNWTRESTGFRLGKILVSTPASTFSWTNSRNSPSTNHGRTSCTGSSSGRLA